MDFIFAAVSSQLCDDNNGTIVYINTKSCWDESHNLKYDYTEEEWNELEPILDKLHLCEVMESIYESPMNVQDTRDMMIREGFKEDPTFTEWASNNI